MKAFKQRKTALNSHQQPLQTTLYQGSVLGTLTGLTSSSPSASLLSSALASSPFLPLSTLALALLHPNLPTAHNNPTPAPPRIPVGAITNAAPLTTDPIAVPATAVARAPMAAYLA